MLGEDGGQPGRQAERGHCVVLHQDDVKLPLGNQGVDRRLDPGLGEPGCSQRHAPAEPCADDPEATPPAERSPGEGSDGGMDVDTFAVEAINRFDFGWIGPAQGDERDIVVFPEPNQLGMEQHRYGAGGSGIGRHRGDEEDFHRCPELQSQVGSPTAVGRRAFVRRGWSAVFVCSAPQPSELARQRLKIAQPPGGVEQPSELRLEHMQIVAAVDE
jgi:hypothetical protein